MHSFHTQAADCVVDVQLHGCSSDILPVHTNTHSHCTALSTINNLHNTHQVYTLVSRTDVGVYKWVQIKCGLNQKT